MIQIRRDTPEYHRKILIVYLIQNKDHKYLSQQECEFTENQKLQMLEEISAQYVVDRDRELKLQRGLIEDVTTQVVPKIPKALQVFCKRHLK